MTYNTEFYKRFCDTIIANTVTTAPRWMSFLETMARNRKCTMQELLMIYYQRPEANDCKSYHEWINVGCQVRRGAIGIAVHDMEDPQKVRYLFDSADTIGHTEYWGLSRELEPDITKVIEAEFRVGNAIGFPALIEYAVSSLLDIYWCSHEREILDGIMECWKGWDECAAKLQFIDAAFYSACYMILERCGYDPRSMYEFQEFDCVPSFYSANAMNTLGETIRSVGNQVLDVIERVITERRKEKTIIAEGEHTLSAFLKPKLHKNDMEVS